MELTTQQDRKRVAIWIDGSAAMTELLFPEDDIYINEAVGEILPQIITHLNSARVLMFDAEKVIDFDIVPPALAESLFADHTWTSGFPNIMPAWRRMNDSLESEDGIADQPTHVNAVFLASIPEDNAEFVEKTRLNPPSQKYVFCLLGPNFNEGTLPSIYHALADQDSKNVRVINGNVLSVQEIRDEVIAAIS